MQAKGGSLYGCEDEQLDVNQQVMETQLNGLATWLRSSDKYDY